MGYTAGGFEARKTSSHVNHDPGEFCSELLEIIFGIVQRSVTAQQNDFSTCFLNLLVFFDDIRHFLLAVTAPASRLQIDVKFGVCVRLAVEGFQLFKSLANLIFGLRLFGRRVGFPIGLSDEVMSADAHSQRAKKHDPEYFFHIVLKWFLVKMPSKERKCTRSIYHMWDMMSRRPTAFSRANHTCPIKIFSELIQPISSRVECEIHHFLSRDARGLSKS